MSRSGSQVDVRQAYPQKAVVQAQVGALAPSAPPGLNPSFDLTRPATARVDVTPSRQGGASGSGSDSRPNRPTSAHTRLLTTYGAVQPSPDQAAVITKQDLRRKRTEEYLSDRVRQIYNDVGRDNRPVKKHLFHDGGTVGSGSGGRTTTTTYKGDAESLQDTIHALKFQLQQDADKRAKLVARCRRLEQVVAMKDKKLEEALALQTQHGSYNSCQRELANRERAYNHMLGKLREKIDQQATTLAAYEDTVNDLKASTKHTRVMELEEGLTQVAMELRLMQTRVEEGEQQLAQCHKQLEDRSESTAQKAVKRLRTVVLSLNEDKKRLEKEVKVLKAYIVAKERELAAFTVAAKSQLKPKPVHNVMSPPKTSVTPRPAVVPDPPTPKPPPAKPAGRPPSASRSRPTSTPGRAVAIPQRPSKSEQVVVEPTKSTTPAKKSFKPAPQPAANMVPPLPLNTCSTVEPMSPDIPSPPPLEKPAGLELLQAKVASAAPTSTSAPSVAVAHVEPVVSGLSPPGVGNATAAAVATRPRPVITSDMEIPPSPDKPATFVPRTADDDWIEDNAKDTTEIERILNGAGGHSTADAGIYPTNDDDMDEADFQALMAFKTSPHDAATADGKGGGCPGEVVEAAKGGGGDGKDDNEERDMVGDMAALKIQKVYKVYSRRRDSMELHRETKKQHRQSSSNKIREALAGAQDAVANSPVAQTNSTRKTAPTRIPTEAQHQAATTIQTAYRRSSVVTTGAPVSIQEADKTAWNSPREGKASDIHQANDSTALEKQRLAAAAHIPSSSTSERSKPDESDEESYSEAATSDGQLTPSMSTSPLEPQSLGTVQGENTGADEYAEPVGSDGQITPSVSNDGVHDTTTSDTFVKGHALAEVDARPTEDTIPTEPGDGGDENHSEPGYSEGYLTPSSSGQDTVYPSEGSKQDAAAWTIQKAFRHASKSKRIPSGRSRPPTSNDVMDDVYSDVADSDDGNLSPSGSQATWTTTSPEPAPPSEVDHTAAATTIQNAYRRSVMAKPSAENEAIRAGEARDDGDEDAVYLEVAASDGVLTPTGSDHALVDTPSKDNSPNEGQQAAAATTIQKAFRASSLGAKSHVRSPDSTLEIVAGDPRESGVVEPAATDGPSRGGPDDLDDSSVDHAKQAAAATIHNAFRRTFPPTPRASNDGHQTERAQTNDVRTLVEDASASPPALSSATNDTPIDGTPPGDMSDDRVPGGPMEAPADDDFYSEAGDSDGKLTPSTSGAMALQVLPHEAALAADLTHRTVGETPPLPTIAQNVAHTSVVSDAGADSSTSSALSARVIAAVEFDGMGETSQHTTAGSTTDAAARMIQHAFRHFSPRSSAPSPPPLAGRATPDADDGGNEYDDDEALYDDLALRDDAFLSDDDDTAAQSAPSVQPTTQNQDVASASDRNLIESVMDHLDDTDDADNALMGGAEAPLEYEDEFMDEDDNNDAENGRHGISEDAHILADGAGE